MMRCWPEKVRKKNFVKIGCEFKKMACENNKI